MTRQLNAILVIVIVLPVVALSFISARAKAATPAPSTFDSIISDDLCQQATSNGGQAPAACQTDSKDPLTNSDGNEGIISKVTKLVGMVVGVLAVLMIMLGGYTYITSSGDTRKIEAAKKTIFAAIIGLIIAASAQLIVRFFISRL